MLRCLDTEEDKRKSGVTDGSWGGKIETGKDWKY
jgi:hypothetical protein